MVLRSILLAFLLMLVSNSGYCQGYSWMRSNFVSYLFTRDAEDYVRRSESGIRDMEEGQEKKDAESLLKAFELLNETSGTQPYTCDFVWAMNEVGLSYRTITLNEHLQLLKFQAKGRYVAVLKNNLKEHGFTTAFSGKSLDKQSTSTITRGIGPYCCVNMHSTDKPYSYTFKGAKSLGSFNVDPTCR